MNSKGENSRLATCSGKGSKSTVQISKTLTYFLRHGGVSKGLTLDEQGWTSLSLLLKLPQFNSVTVDTVKEIVSTNSKQRFALTEREGQLFIRANQGHSLQNINPDLEVLTLEALPEIIVHGTYKKHWEKIKASVKLARAAVPASLLPSDLTRWSVGAAWEAAKVRNKGLHRVTRTHIHLAPGLPGQDQVISGVRSSCELLIYVDVAKAIRDGVAFFRSQNNVILCPGNSDGYLEPKYFSKVVDVHTGFDTRTLPEEICGRFWEFGMIDFQASQKHIFLVFSTKKEAMTALASKVYTSNGKRLFVALRSQRNHVSDKMADKPVEFFLSPVVKNLMAVVPRTDEQLLECVERLLNDVQLRPEEYENRQSVRERIEHFLGLEFPNVACHVFGSSANNLGFREADIDLYAALGYDPYDTPRAADGEAAAAKLTYYLAKHLRRQSWVSNVSAIPKARVPIVKFQQNGIAVDLSFRNAMPIQNTALIRLYTLVHPVVRPYMMVVRFWAKMQRVAGGGKPDTLLTNYALTMLMAFVIMVDRDILPPLADLRRQPYRQVIINGWNCGFGEDTSKYTNKSHNCSVLQLVLEFFEYYASLNSEEWVICPLVGKLISRKDMASKSLAKLPSDFDDYVNSNGNLQHETSLCVQDPFDLTHNVTRGLRKIPLERFQLLCKKSAEILKRVLRLELPLVALFEHVELTDDMYDEVSATGAEGCSEPVNKNDSTVSSHDVIDIDDDADESQDIEILEEVRKVFQVYENGVSESNGASTNVAGKGIKRSSTDAAPVATSNSDQSAASITQRSLTSAEQQLCTNIVADSPFIYRLTIPTGFDLQLASGELTDTTGQERNDENLHELGLKILEFMLAKVYGADVTRTDISDETAAKKFRSADGSNSSSGSTGCIAKLNISWKYELREGKVSLRLLNSSLGGESVSPFTFEHKLTRLQLEDIGTGSTKYGRTREPFFATFYVCVSDEQSGELVLLANTINRSKSDRDFLTRFLCSFRLLTNCCLKKTAPHLLWMKKKVKPVNQV